MINKNLLLIGIIRWSIRNNKINYFNFILRTSNHNFKPIFLLILKNNNNNYMLEYLRYLIESNNIDYIMQIPTTIIEKHKINIVKLLIAYNNLEIFKNLFKYVEDDIVQKLVIFNKLDFIKFIHQELGQSLENIKLIDDIFYLEMNNYVNNLLE